MNRPGALFPRQTRQTRARAEPIFLSTCVSRFFLVVIPPELPLRNKCIFHRNGGISEGIRSGAASRVADIRARPFRFATRLRSRTLSGGAKLDNRHAPGAQGTHRLSTHPPPRERECWG